MQSSRAPGIWGGTFSTPLTKETQLGGQGRVVGVTVLNTCPQLKELLGGLEDVPIMPPFLSVLLVTSALSLAKIK